MFNLRDTYLAVAHNQTFISLKKLTQFLSAKDMDQSIIEKMIRWNNHNSSLK